MEYLFIYLLQMADVISSLAILAGGMLAFLVPVYFIIETNSYWDDEPPKALRTCTDGIILCVLVFGLWAFFPSKQTLLLGAATYYGEKVITSKNIDKKIQKVSEIIDIQLDKYEKELKKNANNNK